MPKSNQQPDKSSNNNSEEEKKFKETYDLKILRRLWPFVWPYRKTLFASIDLLLVGSLLALIRPLIIRATFDRFDKLGNFHDFILLAMFLAVILVLEQVIAFPQIFWMQKVGSLAMADLRTHLFHFLHTRQLRFFDRTPIGRLVTRVTNDVDSIFEMFSSGTLNAIGDLVRLIGIVIIMFSLSWKMAFVSFIILPPVALIITWTRKKIREIFRELRIITAKLNTYLNEQISGILVVQAYNREEKSQVEFDGINQSYRNANYQSILYDSTIDAMIEMVSSVSVALVLWFIGTTQFHVKVSFGTVFAFVAYIDMFFIPIRDLSAKFTMLQSAMSGAERIFELLDNKDEDNVELSRSKQLNILEDGFKKENNGPMVSFSNVTFAYKQNQNVIENISFNIFSGEKVALVGATGSGKSTIASLLLRLYVATQGNIFVLGKSILEFPRLDLRSIFGVVPQEVFLFPGSIASNIAAGQPLEIKRVEETLSQMDMLQWFQSREEGLMSKVSERGANFSSGEKQIIALARALYRNPPIIILDEATANIDSATEERIQIAFEKAVKNRTSLTIAHRLSTVRNADKIIVLHKGHLIEQGNHDNLLHLDGFYARLYHLQQKEQT